MSGFRVLHVITSTDAGGAERMLRRTLRVLSRGPSPAVAARVVSLKRLGSVGSLLRDEGFEVVTLGGERPRGALGAMALPWTEARLVAGVRREIRSFRPGLVQSWLPRADLVARFAAWRLAPVLASVRVIDAERDWAVRLDGATQALVRRWLAVGEAAADHHARLAGIPRDRFTVIPNALEPEELEEPAEAEAWRVRLRGEGLLVGAAARLHAQKGLDVLLRALAVLPGVRVAVAGEGPRRAELAALASSLGVADRVTWLGRLDEPRGLLAACDAFVLPSRFEGMPGALLEAMALARACVATAIPGTTEVARHGETALLVPPDDPEALADALRSLRDDAELRSALGGRAREHVRARHLTPLYARRLLELYAQVASG